MAEFKPVGLVRSLAGHDKEELYIIISDQGEYVYLSDGLRRPLDKQKRKNKKHLQVIGVRDEELEKRLAGGGALRDFEIAAFIRTYKQEEGKKKCPKQT